MLPWTVLDTADLPDGSGTLRLKQRGGEFSIMLGSNELMNSRLSGSEEALARLTCARLGQRPRPALLIGGLGMGFTLRAALAALPGEATVEVAELIPAVAAWARGPMAPVFSGCLDDPRVRLRLGDVGAVIAAGTARYDGILLDVDNGPEGLTVAANDRLYGPAGLGAARTALRPGGVLAVWSSGPDRGFTRRLRDAGFAAEETTVRARSGGRGARHVIWLATR
ncbi:spermidine synthase [Bosea minatitlanensis]|uniref:Spermidine synthase n=1 Tax=Bosea minatitlanensis TaxID=128782 RepID=A0ABW0F028_9HYPH|nr:hypothetical protein [Bosea minatitlanensis]MCT4492795.1 hypothetical protein [Bosea minatitlanensis]